jgi:hypothetical protein
LSNRNNARRALYAAHPNALNSSVGSTKGKERAEGPLLWPLFHCRAMGRIGQSGLSCVST